MGSTEWCPHPLTQTFPFDSYNYPKFHGMGPPTNLINSAPSNLLTCISDNPPNFLHFWPRDLMFIKLFPIFYSNLLNPRYCVPSLFNDIVQASPSFSKIPIPGSMRTTSPYSPEKLQGLEFTTILQMSVFCYSLCADIVFIERRNFRAAAWDFCDICWACELVGICLQACDRTGISPYSNLITKI